MPESCCFRHILPCCFSPPPPETHNSSSSSENSKKTYDVEIVDSGGSVSITSFVADLSSHLKKIGISIALFSNKDNDDDDDDSAAISSCVCILVLSKDFADSKDRLKKLTMTIHDDKVDLIPIFFDVKPSDVRKVETGVFKEAFLKLNDDGWKLAFQKTALISGWKFSDFRGNSRKLLKAVVQNVMKKVYSASLMQVAKHPVGLTEKTEKLESLLKAGVDSSRAKVLGIVGMGGIGKTTLAKEFFNTIIKTRSKAACFVEDVKGRIEKTGLERVQSHLLQELLQIDHQIHSTNQGKYLLKKCLNRAEVIIVLDNIDDSEHLDALWVPEYIHQNSIVLITTRNSKLVECIPNSLIYNMEGLERKHARELFCRHAFPKPSIPLGFDLLVEGFVSYCDGLPLSLETLGGKLCGEELPVWEETLKNISYSLPGDIERHLRVSFDGLDSSEKQIFLDIALFFIGEDQETTIRIWNALGWFGSVGVQSLQQKCLVKVENGQFQMHDQLRQMAEKIVDEEDTKNPGRRSRVWRPNDVMTVLSLECGTEHVEVITLATKQIQNERLGSLVVPKSKIIRNQYGGLKSTWSLRSFKPMTELRVLILEDACVEGDFRLLSKKILWLRWRHCPSGPLPMELPIQNLLVLDLSGGRLSSLWSDTRQIPVHLEELHLQGCVSLQNFPKSIKCLIGLKKLILSHCLSLVDIPDGLCDIHSLKYLDLSGCSGLRSLPDRLGNWKRLQYLDLSKCRKLESLPSSFGGLENLEHLALSSCSALSKLPSSFNKIEGIRYLNMSMCLELESEEDLTAGFNKLEFLDTMLIKRFDLPRAITFQHCIRTLRISCSHFKALPHYLGALENLEELSFWQGYEIKTLDPFVFAKLNHLKHLTIGQFPLLKGLGSSLGNLTQLKSLSIGSCGILQLPDEVGFLKGLETLIILDCSNLTKLPTTVKELSCLTTFSLSGCSNLQLDPEAFPSISTIQKLHLGNCLVTNHLVRFLCQGGIALKEIELKNMRLPVLEVFGSGPSTIASFSVLTCSNITSFEVLRGISSLKIEDCPGLKKVTVPFHNTSLQTMHLGNCKNLLEVCSIENLRYLKSLNMNGCFDLRTVAGLDKLNRLSELHLFLSDWYLSHQDNDSDWLKKTFTSTINIPHTTHLSAIVDLEKGPLNLLSCFQKIPQHSPHEFKFKLPPFNNSRKSFCGVVICFIARHSLSKNMVSRLNERKDILYHSSYLRLVNGPNDTEICQYKISDPSSFFHVSIFMDESLISEMLADGSELVISSLKEDMVYGAWIFLIPANQKNLAGEVTCNLIDNLKEHKSSIGDYVPRIELDTKKLEDEVGKLVHDMDLRGIHLLGITNYIIERTYKFNQVAIYVETITPFTWKKHQQVLFEGIDKFKYLDLELGDGCRNLVENPMIDSFESRIVIWNPHRSRSYTFKERFYPPIGSFEYYVSLEKIISSHKKGFI